ncbi:MAG: CRISPR-associated protein Cas5 [Armatimonadetes bacterium]|nr:CRISPR-associated protein Cas5 [Armatimonadota bacterium]MDW8029563.1 CRISPR-associated protein Cas5 [Armatimonadota bacterium]
MEQKEAISAVRIVLAAYTASFRVPAFVGHQLTLTVPPICTVFGLISAAAGRWIMPDEIGWLAYRCTYESKATDLEAIFTVERPRPAESARFVTRNVIQREFLSMPNLTLYLPPEWERVFRQPRYTLLLGRTQDVAAVMSITLTDLNPVSAGTVSGVLLPFELIALNNVSAWLQRLPIAFTDEPQRRPTRMHLFGIVDAHHPTELSNGNGWLVQDAQDKTILVLYRKEWMLHGERTVSEVR